MKTYVMDAFFLRGDEIPEKPYETVKCYRCDKDIAQDDKCAKIASLVVGKQDKLMIDWTWVCNECTEKLQNLLEEKT